MQAIVLAGGLGTRLASLFPDRPKALVPVAGYPFLTRQLTWLRKNGITQIHVAAGHGASLLEKWIAENRLPLTISTEPTPLGTGGGLLFAASYVRSDPFFVLNGDSLLPHLNLQQMVRDHKERNNLVTIAVAPVENAGRYGLVELAENRKIIGFHEKAAVTAGWVNGGVYLIQRSLLEELPQAASFSLEQDVFPALALKGVLGAWKSQAPLLDMGTPDGLRQMADYFAASEHG